MPVYHRPGIYAFRNLVTEKVYVGSSVNVLVRKMQHVWALRRGKHPNAHLQSAYNKYGEDTFVFSVLERCAVAQLKKREQFWIRELQANGANGYNFVHPVRGKHPNQNAAEAHKAYWQSLTPAAKRVRVRHLVEPINRKGNSVRQLERWKDPKYRAKRIAGLDRGRTKTNSKPTQKMLAVLAKGRAKAIKRWKTDAKLRERQRDNALQQWRVKRIRDARLDALDRGRKKTNDKKKANAKAKRANQQ